MIERTKPEVDDRYEVACPDIVRVILQENRAGLRGGCGWTNTGDVGLDGALGDVQLQLEQLPTNAFGSP